MKKKELVYIQKQIKEQNVSELSLSYKVKGPMTKFTCSKDIFDRILSWWDDTLNLYESFHVLLLNRANNEIGIFKISQGSGTGTVVDSKMVCAVAILSNASTIVLIHNHPSGNKKPSDADIRITSKMKEGLDLFGINLLDHLIITPQLQDIRSDYFSFTDEGLI